MNKATKNPSSLSLSMKNMSRNGLAGAILGLFGVVLGALGAHALKGILSNDALESYKTGVYYLQWHASLILFLAFIFKSEVTTPKYVRWGIRFFFIGIGLFTGSILGLVFLSTLGLNARFLGPITPLGGFSLMLGWFCLILNFLQRLKYRNTDVN